MTAFDSGRRRFLAATGLAAGSSLMARQAIPTQPEPKDEAAWREVRAAFPSSDRLLNLNNAGVSPQPHVVEAAMLRAYRFANRHPDVNMWETLDETRGLIKGKLAALADCDADEIALNRNATEGLCTAIYGIDLAAGDEVLLSDWDYDSMRHAWQQRAHRDAIVLKWAPFDLMDSDDAIVAAYRDRMTSRTKVLHLTHMVHYTGRVLPIEALCRMAGERQVLTIVDAAQSFAQLSFSFRRVGCDYMAASLHKWLCAPFGTGMLIVSRPRIESLWPLLAPYDRSPAGIAKLDGWSLGTYSSPAENAIEAAIDFHNRIGTAAIHARLRELSRYWTERVSSLPGMKFHTPLDSADLGAVTLFSLNGRSADDVERALRQQHGIRVRARHQAKLSGVRVSPHIYTSKADLDRLVDGLRALAG